VKKADWILLAFVAILLPSLYATLWHGSDPGETVRIVAAGHNPVSLPLDRNQRLSVQGAIGTSVIEVRNGKARFVSSPCAGKVCIHSGWLHSGGEFAACLPNRISIEIAGVHNKYDSLNF
jgi:hypothetical protein